MLAVLATFGGLVGVPYALSGGAIPNYFERTLEPVIERVSHRETNPALENAAGNSAAMPHADTAEHATETANAEHSTENLGMEITLAIVSVVFALLGLIGGFVYFNKNPLKTMPEILQDKWHIDEIYNNAIVNPLTNFSRKFLWQDFDVGVVDGIVNGIGHFVTALGGIARGVQVGFVRSYAAFILFGALIVIGYFIYYGFRLVG